MPDPIVPRRPKLRAPLSHRVRDHSEPHLAQHLLRDASQEQKKPPSPPSRRRSKKS